MPFTGIEEKDNPTVKVRRYADGSINLVATAENLYGGAFLTSKVKMSLRDIEAAAMRLNGQGISSTQVAAVAIVGLIGKG